MCKWRWVLPPTARSVMGVLWDGGDMVILASAGCLVPFCCSSDSDYPAVPVLCYDQTIQPSRKNVLLKALCGSYSQLDLYNRK